MLKRDLLAYVSRDRLDRSAWLAILSCVYKHPALIAVVSFRLGKGLQRLPAPFRSIGLALYYLLVYPPVRLFTGVEIPLSCDFGPGLTIWHYGNTIFGGGTVAGARLSVNQGALVARRYRDGKIATIGDDVTLGARCIVLCERIGDGATIGAGAVVVKNVGASATVVGNPARELPVRRQEVWEVAA